MRNFIKIGLFISTAVFAFPGCHGEGSKPSPLVTPLSQASLENTQWKLVRLGDAPAAVLPGGRDAGFILVPSERRVQGYTGCNRIMGRYELNGAKLRFERIATTRMACAGESGEQERKFLRALEATATWNIQGENLEIRDEKGVLLARFESVYSR